MANQFKTYAQVQFIITDGDRNTSNIQISGSMRIDWNKYLQKKGLMDCLKFGTKEVDCNVPDVSLITIAGDS